MNDTELTQTELEKAKRTIDYVERNEDSGELVVVSTDYGVTIYQHFEYRPVLAGGEGDPILDVEVSEDGWASTYDGGDAGRASEEAHEAAREYARKNTRSIFESIPTMMERQLQNAEIETI